MIDTHNESAISGVGDRAATTRSGDLGRLLPRHSAPAALMIEWDIRTTRRVLSKGQEVSVPAIVRDISLDGALIEVSDDIDRKVGSKVQIRILGIDGTATVRHRRQSPSGDFIRYGIHFRGGPAFVRTITEIVGALRKNDSELRKNWESQR